jgi:hypothetical protein
MPQSAHVRPVTGAGTKMTTAWHRSVAAGAWNGTMGVSTLIRSRRLECLD